MMHLYDSFCLLCSFWDNVSLISHVLSLVLGLQASPSTPILYKPLPTHTHLLSSVYSFLTCVRLLNQLPAEGVCSSPVTTGHTARLSLVFQWAFLPTFICFLGKPKHPIKVLFVCVCVFVTFTEVYASIPSLGKSQRTACKNPFSPSTMWILSYQV